MNIIHISAHFPPNYHLFSARLKDQGACVFGITDQKFEQLHPELQSALSDHYKVSSFHNRDEVFTAVQYFQDKYKTIDRVESHLEPWISLEAEIREKWNIPGRKPKDIDCVQKKSAMKERFIKAGIPAAQGEIVRSFRGCMDFIAEVGFPVIIKPDQGVGAQDTHKIENGDDLDIFFKNRNKECTYFIEEFIEGKIITFDGLSDQDGNPIFYTSHEYEVDARTVASEQTDFYYYNQRVLSPDLLNAGKACVKAFDVREKFFHIEFFRTQDNDLLAIEINMRPPGGLTTDMFNYAHDIDVYDLYAQVITKNLKSFEYERKYHCAHISRREKFQYKLSSIEITRNLEHRLCLYAKLNPLYAKVMGEEVFLVRSPSLCEIHQIAKWIHHKT